MPARKLTPAEIITLSHEAWERERVHVMRSAQEAGLDPQGLYQALREHDAERGLMAALMRECLGIEGAYAVLKRAGEDPAMLDPSGDLQTAALGVLGVKVNGHDRPFDQTGGGTG